MTDADSNRRPTKEECYRQFYSIVARAFVRIAYEEALKMTQQRQMAEERMLNAKAG